MEERRDTRGQTMGEGKRGEIEHTEIKDLSEKPVNTHLVYLACLGPMLLFTADTNKPHNEMRARKRMVGLPTHQP